MYVDNNVVEQRATAMRATYVETPQRVVGVATLSLG